MNTKTDVEVVINGKQYTLCGYESSEYLQHIASHINEKYAEFKLQEGYNRLDADMRNVLLAINLSDDFFKAQKTAADMRMQREEMEKEIFEMKHELIARQTKIEELEKKCKDNQVECEKYRHQVIRLEAEMGKESSVDEKPEITEKTTKTTISRNHRKK